MSPVTPPIPLLLVADSPDTCERIASALLSAPAFYRIERVTSDELTQNGPPGHVPLALVDGNLRSAKQPQVVRQLNASNIAVVALVDSRDVQTLQEVVLSGAAALVATPFVDTQLWETVATALTRGSKATTTEPVRNTSRGYHTHGLLVTLYGAKGGIGTSVLASNLAVTLQERSNRGAVLVEIGDGTGSLAIMLNLRSDHSLGDLLARFDPGDTELLAGVLAKHPSGLRVLLGPSSPGVRIPTDLLEDVIDSLQLMFDYVIVDMHTSARSSAVTILRRANAALVVIAPEMAVLHQGRLFVESIEATLPDARLNIVLNRSTLPSGVPVDAIRRHLKMQIAMEIPDDQALSRRVLIVVFRW
jgi:pilus assembly protein CpaE